ncbi:MAG: YedE family putative selenium transporter [Planctomycetota bacterium]
MRGAFCVSGPWGSLIAGSLIGGIAALLQLLGNPHNMGLCVACFERDIAGALGWHQVATVQYLRPEVPGLVLGAFVAALLTRELRSCAAPSPFAMFSLGIFAMVGALAFMGCPWRLLLRLAGGDLNALVGLAGLLVGVAVASGLLRRGYSLGRSSGASGVGWIMPALMLGLLALAVTGPGMLRASERGPGAMRAPLGVSLVAGILIGVIAQRTRFCTVGPLRTLLLDRDYVAASALLGFALAAAIVNLISGRVAFGFAGQPLGHSHHVWNFLGMMLAGLAFSLAGGCPGRMLVAAGEGEGGAAVFVMGTLAGAAVSHNFGLAAGPDRVVDGVLQVGGPAPSGQLAVVVGLAFCLLLGFAAREARVRSGGSRTDGPRHADRASDSGAPAE